MESPDSSFSGLLSEHLGGLTAEKREKISRFYEMVVEENKIQNLTRLISPTDFYHGHIVDVNELLKTQWLTYPALDIGSGAGVPGLVAAMIDPHEWILTESEKKKADFLKRAVKDLGYENLIRVIPDRVEEFLKKNAANALIARAVGTVSRIYSWINKCSTWNKLILMKGPGWEEEWQEFEKSKLKGRLKQRAVHSYTVGIEAKKRVLVLLDRV